MDDVGFEHFSVLPHIQYNSTDKPIIFFDLIIDVVLNTWLRAMQRGLVCPQVDLCVGKFRVVPGGTKSLLVS